MRSAYDVILTPVISEQSMDVAQDKKYTFKVAVDANKTEVKSAVEEIFGYLIFPKRSHDFCCVVHGNRVYFFKNIFYVRLCFAGHFFYLF